MLHIEDRRAMDTIAVPRLPTDAALDAVQTGTAAIFREYVDNSALS